MPEGNIWLKEVVFHFTIHIFFTICEALFHAMACIISPMSTLPSNRMAMYGLSFCSWDIVTLIVFLDIDYNFPRTFLKDFEVLFVVIYVINCNDIFSFNFDSGSAWGFLARQVTDHLISCQKSLYDPIVAESELLISSVWQKHQRLCGQPHSATDHAAVIHFIPFHWVILIQSAHYLLQ